MRIAFIAYPYYQEFGRNVGWDEASFLAAAFKKRGVQLDIVDGTQSDEEWRRYDAVLPLGCWGYHKDPPAFRAFVHRLSQLGVRLINDAPTLLWNMDKSYLLDLHEKGITVGAFRHFPVGSSVDLAAEIERMDWPRYVIKPTISANSLQTIVAEGPPNAEVLTLAQRILTHSGLLLQPFFEEVPRHGEWSLMFYGDTYSHAVIKVPKAGDFRSQPDHGGTVSRAEPPPHIITQARAALHAAPERPIYGRVDGFLRDDALQLIELELIEPFMFMNHADAESAATLCDALISALR